MRTTSQQPEPQLEQADRATPADKRARANCRTSVQQALHPLIASRGWQLARACVAALRITIRSHPMVVRLMHLWAAPNSPLKMGAVGLLALLACVLVRPLPPWGFGANGSDGALYYQAALAIHHGVSPYSAAVAWDATHLATDSIYMDVYTYPPFLAMLLAPVTALPLAAFVAVWSLLSIACAVYLASFLVQLTMPSVRSLNRLLALGLVLNVVLLFGPLRHSMRAAQTDIELIALVVGAWSALRSGRKDLSGILLGVAIAVKPTYVLLLGFHLWHREWRAGAVALITGALALVLPFFIVPHQTVTDFLSVSAAWNVPGFLMAPKSISLFGMLQRLFFTIPPLWRVFAAPFIARAVEAMVCLGVYVGASACIASDATQGDGQWDYAFGMAVLVMLLGSPLTEDAHLSLALLPLGVLCARYITRLRLGDQVAATPLALVALFFVYVTLPVRGLATFSNYGGWRAVIAGYWFYGLAFLAGLYIWAGRRKPGSSPIASVLAYIQSRMHGIQVRALAQRSAEQRALLMVLLIGVLSGALYVIVFLAESTIYAPDHGTVQWGITAYYAATLGLFALYGWVLLLCYRNWFSDRKVRRLVILLPVVFNIVLLLTRPYLSIDVLSYIGHGYLGTVPGRNPYVDAVSTVASLPLGPQLEAFGWKPVHGISPYGPLWTTFEIGVVRLTHSIPAAILLIKGGVVAASLGTAALIWVILGRVHPARQLLGTLCYLWCPMSIMEFAGDGHNDALMIVFVLLALLFTVSTQPARSLVGMLLGALVKYVPVVLVPAQMVYLWHTRSSTRKLLIQTLLGIAACLAVAVLAFQPLWVGGATLDGVRNSNQLASSGPRVWIDYVIGHVVASSSGIEQVIGYMLDGAFVTYVLFVSFRVRDAKSLLHACARIALVYFFLAFPGYWPWYAALPVALMALAPSRAFLWMIFALSLCSRLVAPFDQLRADGVVTLRFEFLATNAVGLALPLVIAAVLCAMSWRPASDWALVTQAMSLRVRQVLRGLVPS